MCGLKSTLRIDRPRAQSPCNLCLLDVGGMTAEMLPLAPRLASAGRGELACRPHRSASRGNLPAQASLLTGTERMVHGIVGNVGSFRTPMESPVLAAIEPAARSGTALSTAQRPGSRPEFTCAKPLLVVHQGAQSISALDSQAVLRRRRQQGVRASRRPVSLAERVEATSRALFSFFYVWGPRAGSLHAVDSEGGRHGFGRGTPGLNARHLPISIRAAAIGSRPCDFPGWFVSWTTRRSRVDEAQRAGAQFGGQRILPRPVKHAK